MMTTDNNEVDLQAVEAFGERLVGFLNGGALTLMISIGHRTGSFDAMAEMPPAASEEIAKKSGLQERYVREWLGSMVTGGIVHFDEQQQTYDLPVEHAAVLTRAARPNNVSATMQWISVLGQVEDEIVQCFREGGGVPYSSYNRFHEVMAEESDQTTVAGMIEHIVPAVPGLSEKLEQGIDAMDVGCGSGWALCELAAAYPHSRFSGYDLSKEGIGRAQQEAERRGLSNIQFSVKDISHLGEIEAFDLITAFDVVHDQAQPATVLNEIAAALRPDGTFLMQDIGASSHVHHNRDHDLGPFLYTISCMHCMTVSLAQGGAGLGAVWGKETACNMLAEAGFASVEVKELEHDFLNYYYIARKS